VVQAIDLYRQVLAEPVIEQSVAAQAELRLATLLRKTGRLPEAHAHYSNVVRAYSGENSMTSLVSKAEAAISEIEAATVPVGMTIRKVLDNLRGGGFPYSLSSDGRYLGSFDAVTGNAAVYDLSDGSFKLATDYGTWDAAKGFTDTGVISPDGRYVAYAFYEKGGTSPELRLAEVGSRHSRTLVDLPEDEWAAPQDWSPDGKQVLSFIRGTVEQDGHKRYRDKLVLTRAEDGSTEVLREMTATRRRLVTNAAFSPDGKFIAYTAPERPESTKTQIQIISRAGEAVSVVAPGNWRDTVLDWAPDNSTLLFLSNRSGSYGIWSVELEDGRSVEAPVLVSADVGEIGRAGFSQDGSFYYVVSRNDQHAFQARITPVTGKVLEEPRRITERLSRSPSWSADGKILAYLTWRGAAGIETSQITIRNLDSGAVWDVAPPVELNSLHSATVLADGSKLFSVGRNEGDPFDSLFQFDLRTGATTRLAVDRSWIGRSSWTLDGNLILSAVNRTKVMARGMPTGTERTVFENPVDARIRAVSVSPDGKQVAFVRRHDGLDTNGPIIQSIDIVDIETGTYREVYRSPEGVSFEWWGNRRSIAWTPDSQYLLFSVHYSDRAKAYSELLLLPAAGGEARSTGIRAEHRIADLQIHPDGQTIGFTVGEFGYDLWVIENFLGSN
ncbi:MAG: PD40 domain-containing protein, partial [Acidobacteriota bacterium]